MGTAKVVTPRSASRPARRPPPVRPDMGGPLPGQDQRPEDDRVLDAFEELASHLETMVRLAYAHHDRLCHELGEDSTEAKAAELLRHEALRVRYAAQRMARAALAPLGHLAL